MDDLLPRAIEAPLADHLRVMPAVVVTGARQTGKSTLAQHLTPGTRRYLTLDDLDVRGAARHDPDALLGRGEPIAIDEVQRTPELLHAIKQSIDRDRSPGRFLLTGSANLLLMRQVSESLAGRASYLTLWPMTRREQMGLGRGGMWEELLQASDADWLECLSTPAQRAEDWMALARRGGFPTAAVHLEDDQGRLIWFDGYVRTYLERDLRELSTVAALPDFRRLMRATCLRMGNVVNQTELGRDVGLAQSTVHRYLNLLETSYLLVRLPAYAVSRTKRLVKSPKLYWADSGIALHLTGESEPGGAHLENLVLSDLLTWRDHRLGDADVFYWRTAAGAEVDFVVEAEGQLMPIEVKSGERPRLRDTSGLRAFRAEYPERARSGLLLHAGDLIDWITPDVLAAPWWTVL